MIDADVAKAATHFGLDPLLVQAVVHAEGNILKAVQCSFPAITTREQALDITCRSCVHAMSDYVKTHCGQPFVAYWAERWAPVGAANDPQGLNKNWPINVTRYWAPTPVPVKTIL